MSRTDLRKQSRVLLDGPERAPARAMLKAVGFNDADLARPPSLHLILTGRNAPQALMDRADLVTEMREIKHPWQQKIPAIRQEFSLFTPNSNIDFFCLTGYICHYDN